MTTTQAGYYLDSFLAPHAPVLKRKDVTDIWINRPGEVWTESTGGGIERIEEPGLDLKLLERLARQIAAYSSQGISRAQPLLAATLPDGSRIPVVDDTPLPPVEAEPRRSPSPDSRRTSQK